MKLAASTVRKVITLARELIGTEAELHISLRRKGQVQPIRIQAGENEVEIQNAINARITSSATEALVTFDKPQILGVKGNKHTEINSLRVTKEGIRIDLNWIPTWFDPFIGVEE